ncbi:MAG TPA: ABC transporter ATP-binding protein [Candidatus Paceibacterota bacterium]|nr:ABC transporter ATP-binding protein [Candidatus Paceibacterota bacterium]
MIEVKNLKKSYDSDGGGTLALRGINFSVKPGEFVAVVGPSGSGKSTLLHILGFLDRQTSGEYFFAGRSMSDHSDEELAFVRNNKMGFIFQTFNLLPRMTALENVELPLIYAGIPEKARREMAEEALKSVGLAHRIRHESSKLSGGEKGRVAIARALVNRPTVIFADEPTGNLDSESGRQIMEIIRNLNETHGHTVILITHETYTANYAERVIKLLDGKIVSDEKVAQRTTGFSFKK